MKHGCESSWRERRDEILEQARTIVIKVGSAVLTTNGELDLRVLNNLADQIAALHDQGREIILVSSGAVSAGRKYLRIGAEGSALPEKQASAAVGQSRLMHNYDEAFERFHKTTAQILVTRDDLCSRHRFLNTRNTFSTLLANRVVPIVNENDTVVVQELNFGDNDFLASLILNLVQADLFINLTTADGVFAGNPDSDPDAVKYECIDSIRQMDLESMCRGKTLSGAGGMYSKLLAARRADQIGVPTLIVSGNTRFVLEKIFSGQDLGTWIMPGQRFVSQRKFWLAYNLAPEGRLLLDDGAKEAVLFKGKSLLPAGIREVRGSFGAGALVELLGSDGKRIGAGLSNYSSSDLERIAGRKTAEIPQILGDWAEDEEAVHRDNLLLDVAY
jgi:glutamate 5-kinase